MKKILSFMLWLFGVFVFGLNHNVLAQALPPTEGTAANPCLNLSDDCLKGVGVDCFDYEKCIWIDNPNNDNKTALEVIQDVVLWVTYAVWTILVIVLIYCGIKYIFAAWTSASEAAKLKRWMINAWIWALLVRWAYIIVKLVQYIAEW